VSNAFIPPETVPIGALHVQDGEKILGTHIFPLRLLGWPFELTNAIEITRSYITPFDDLEVLVTRMGGLFVRAMRASKAVGTTSNRTAGPFSPMRAPRWGMAS
jgi:hypothetical protein